MPRSLRIIRPGVWYHITARGIERRRIFHDDRDRSHFLELLAELPELFRLRIFAFVLMDNHYHLLVGLQDANLSAAMRWLNLSYSVWFNRRHRRAGYLFQGRFKSILVDPDSWGLGLSAYIHLNPVRTGRFGLSKADRQRDRTGVNSPPSALEVRERIDLLRDYRWSSYRSYAGLAAAPPWLDSAEVLAKGGGIPDEQKQNYPRYVESQARQGLRRSPWEDLSDRIFLGTADFINALKKQARQALKKQKIPAWLMERKSIGAVIAAVEKAKGEAWADFKDRHGDGGQALVLKLARRQIAISLGQLAHQLKLKPTVNVSMIIKRYEKRIATDKIERALAQQAEQMLNATT